MKKQNDEVGWTDALARSAELGERSWLGTLLLSIFLGFLGADRFYLGYTVSGLLKLFTLGGMGVWWLIDIILIVNGTIRDVDGKKLI